MQKGIATLTELQTHYSITDILDRCDGLDAIEDAEEVIREAQKRNKDNAPNR